MFLLIILKNGNGRVEEGKRYFFLSWVTLGTHQLVITKGMSLTCYFILDTFLLCYSTTLLTHILKEPTHSPSRHPLNPLGFIKLNQSVGNAYSSRATKTEWITELPTTVPNATPSHPYKSQVRNQEHFSEGLFLTICLQVSSGTRRENRGLSQKTFF